MSDPQRPIRTRQRDERGIAMVVAVTTAAVGIMLVSMMVATALHLQSSTTRSRDWNLALQIAEAGVERAVVHLTGDLSYAGTGASVETVPGGDFVTAVTTPRPGWRTIRSTGYVPDRTVSRVRRTIEVTYGPSKAFDLALFSETTLNVKNDAGVFGNVFANESVLVENNSVVHGSVFSATGFVKMENNAEVRATDEEESGNVYSGGFEPRSLWGVHVDANAVVERDVRVQVEDCNNTRLPAPDLRPAYNLLNTGGVIGGMAVAAGTVTGGPSGRTSAFTCELRHERRSLPQFTWDPTLYTAVTEWRDAASFNATAGPRLSGVHHVVAGATERDPVVDLTGKTITGDFTLVTTARFRYGNEGGSRPFYDGPADASVVVAVLNESASEAAPAVEIANQLELPRPGPAVLFFSTGLMTVKNDASTAGAVYAGKLALKNNLDVTYDARVERIIGFGEHRFERVRYVELPTR